MRATKNALILLAIWPTIALTEGKEWSPATYPNPTADEGYRLCQRPAKGFVCDPDSLISRESANVVCLFIVGLTLYRQDFFGLVQGADGTQTVHTYCLYV